MGRLAGGRKERDEELANIKDAWSSWKILREESDERNEALKVNIAGQIEYFMKDRDKEYALWSVLQEIMVLVDYEKDIERYREKIASS